MIDAGCVIVSLLFYTECLVYSIYLFLVYLTLPHCKLYYKLRLDHIISRLTYKKDELRCSKFCLFEALQYNDIPCERKANLHLIFLGVKNPSAIGEIFSFFLGVKKSLSCWQ